MFAERTNEELSTGGLDLITNPAAALGTATIIHKDEELPFLGNRNGQGVTGGADAPQTDSNGMKIMGTSGAGATGRDING